MTFANKKETYTPSVHKIVNSLSGISDGLNDEKLSRCHSLKYISDHVDRPPSVLAKASLIFGLSVILLNPSDSSSSLTNALGLIPASYNTLQFLGHTESSSNTPGLKKKENLVRKEKLKKWLDYWVIYSTTCIFEKLVGEDLILSVIPLWSALKAGWIVWFLVGLLDDDLENEVRPEPLRLRSRSIIATKDSPFDSSSTSSDDTSVSGGSPYSPSTSVPADTPTETETGFEESSISPDPEPASSESPTAISPGQARELRAELAELDSPPLSRTPDLPRRADRAVTPITGISSNPDNPDTSDVTEHSPQSKRGEQSDSEDTSSGSDETSGSDDSDNSDDVVLPAGTPLDELALAGKKTLELDSSDEEYQDDRNRYRKSSQKMIDILEKEEGRVAPGSSQDDKHDMKSRGEDLDQCETNIEVAKTSPANTVDIEKTNDDLTKGTDSNETKLAITETPSPARSQGSGAKKSDERPNLDGEVVKLSVEELLTMNGGDQPQCEHTDLIDGGEKDKKEAMRGTPPLMVSQKAGIEKSGADGKED
ncbi:hypothetical protein I203_103322 [Kwoniella mangroviensis CBS 8507]|uniref:uncharacterized protein n=1 Tax=Kwoniella mangroviensis CBS 8507 TaxID=1296122 RepID=UPI00080CF738|nr:uncharacterized protein I203_06027 [Kwoniella mangroviensis CBS 8507]OCF64783.1 hypothetical protein I203_06027 [Kwoniella mangroviensis CBS 8507]